MVKLVGLNPVCAVESRSGGVSMVDSLQYVPSHRQLHQESQNRRDQPCAESMGVAAYGIEHL